MVRARAPDGNWIKRRQRDGYNRGSESNAGGATMAMQPAEIERRLSGTPGWQQADNTIRREFQLHSFREAISFLVRIAFEAEQRDHHPEIFNVYNRVMIALSTHDAGGVTEKDFDLAAAIDHIAAGWVR
jgi:4a-hydroxytetrahydrobiopterin dehydratase